METMNSFLRKLQQNRLSATTQPLAPSRGGYADVVDAVLNSAYGDSRIVSPQISIVGAVTVDQYPRRRTDTIYGKSRGIFTVDRVSPDDAADQNWEWLRAALASTIGVEAVRNTARESSGTITNTLSAAAGSYVEAYGVRLLYNQSAVSNSAVENTVSLSFAAKPNNGGFAAFSVDSGTPLFTPELSTNSFIAQFPDLPNSSVELYVFFTLRLYKRTIAVPAIVCNPANNTGTEVAATTVVVTTTTESGNGLACTAELLIPGTTAWDEASKRVPFMAGM